MSGREHGRNSRLHEGADGGGMDRGGADRDAPGGESVRRMESGRNDMRLLPAALSAWTANLAAHALFERMTHVSGAEGSGAGEGGAFADTPTPWWLIMALGICVGMVAACLMLRAGRILRVLTPARRHMLARAGLVACCAAAIAAMSAVAADLRTWHDPASAIVRAGGASVQATVHIDEPVLASNMRDADCQTDVSLSALTAEGMVQPSHARVRVYADAVNCTKLTRGATQRLIGDLEPARFGGMSIWLRLGGDAAVETLKPPSVMDRTIHHIHERFLDLTGDLDDQGRVLVPGLTLGVLGQERYMGIDGDENKMPDPTYARALEECFRRSGIMHLMAVSGGHFVLIGALVRRLCALVLLPRRLVAVIVALSMWALAALMFPSDSVTRALVMGFFSAAAFGLGRRPQALSALCWTVVGTLIVAPEMGRSFGFALSCGAVLGIVLSSHPIATALSHVMPKAVADIAAMTISAQMFALPIQTLMEPGLPLASVPANILVAPVVGFATIAGLCALMTAWWAPAIALVPVRVASAGTRVMERCATWLGGEQSMVVPWAGGVAGAVLMVAVETAIVMTCMGMARLRARLCMPDDGSEGMNFRVTPADRMRQWWEDTRRMMEGE